jgi:hypothetical protein
LDEHERRWCIDYTLEEPNSFYPLLVTKTLVEFTFQGGLFKRCHALYVNDMEQVADIWDIEKYDFLSMLD